MGFADILSNLFQFLLVACVAFVLFCIIASYLRFQTLTQNAEQARPEGMDPRDAFEVQIANRLGTVHREPEPFCVMISAPRGLDLVAAQHGEAEALEFLTCFETRVRAATRAADVVMRIGGNRVGVILETGRRNAESIARRVLARVRAEPCRCNSGLVLPVSGSAGVSSHPENGERLRVLVDSAVQALGEAQAAGTDTVALAAGAEARPEAPADEEAAVSVPMDSRWVDPLTGLLRPERVGSAVSKYMAKFRRQEHPVSMLLLDVDHLRRYNEHYGREAGDGLLRGLGQLLQTAVREDDLVARLGDEEFLIVMPCSPSQAWIAGQRLVSDIKKNPFKVGNSTLRITVSIGVAGYPDHGGNPRYLLESADIAMHAAKDRGRNMCLLYEDSMQMPAPARKPTDVF